MILVESSRGNRSQALPEVGFLGLRCLVKSLGAGMRRPWHGVAACPLGALV